MRTFAALGALCLALAALAVAHQGRLAALQNETATELWELGGGLDSTVPNPGAFATQRQASGSLAVGGGFRHFLTSQVAFRPDVSPRPRALRKASMLATRAAREERGAVKSEAKGTSPSLEEERGMVRRSSHALQLPSMKAIAAAYRRAEAVHAHDSHTPSLEAIAAAYRRAEAVNRGLERSMASSPPHAAAPATAAASTTAVASNKHAKGDEEAAEVDALKTAAATLDGVTKSMAGPKFVATPSHLADVSNSLATLSDSIGKVQPVRLPARRPTQGLRVLPAHRPTQGLRPARGAAPHESVAARVQRIEEDVLLHFDRLGIQRLRAKQARTAKGDSASWLVWLQNL